MAADYIPTRDVEAVHWMRTFAAAIASAPSAYALSPADAATISDVVQAFANTYAAAAAPTTRTSVTVAQKSEARAAAVAIVRQYAGLIKLNAGISNEAKIAIGIRPLNRQRRRIEVPTSSPLLKLISAAAGSHLLRFNDSNSPTRRAKPFGAAQLQLFVHIGDEQARSPDEAPFRGAYTTDAVTVSFDHKDGGKYATYFARWASRRGETGPWSSPVGMHIAA